MTNMSVYKHAGVCAVLNSGLHGIPKVEVVLDSSRRLFNLTLQLCLSHNYAQ